MVDIMSKQPKKPKAAPPPASPKAPQPVLYLRLTPEHEAALVALIARQRIRPDRTAVGLTALEELFAKEGLWPPPAGK